MKLSRRQAFLVIRKVALVVVLLATIGMPLWSLRADMVLQWNDEVRQLKTKRLHVARALQVLKDHPSVISTLAEAPTTVESLTLSLVEAVKAQSISVGANLDSFSVSDSMVTQDNARESSALQSLRIELSASLLRAIDVLALFDAVRQVTDWRAMEVRGCTLKRVVELGRLSAKCSIELYYFPELDT